MGIKNEYEVKYQIIANG